jgi:hypothetical protein
VSPAAFANPDRGRHRPVVRARQSGAAAIAQDELIRLEERVLTVLDWNGLKEVGDFDPAYLLSKRRKTTMRLLPAVPGARECLRACRSTFARLEDASSRVLPHRTPETTRVKRASVQPAI